MEYKKIKVGGTYVVHSLYGPAKVTIEEKYKKNGYYNVKYRYETETVLGCEVGWQFSETTDFPNFHYYLRDIIEKFIEVNDGNLFARGIVLKLSLYDSIADVESIWYGEDDEQFYVHCENEDFEADVPVNSLSKENKVTIGETLMRYI